MPTEPFLMISVNVAPTPWTIVRLASQWGNALSTRGVELLSVGEKRHRLWTEYGGNTRGCLLWLGQSVECISAMLM